MTAELAAATVGIVLSQRKRMPLSPRARRDDPTTSHAAADSITPEGREASEIEVLAILAEARSPLTAAQIVRMHDTRVWQLAGARAYSDSRLRTALKQLVDDVLVVQDGEGRSKSGRRAATWRLADGGAA